MCTAAIRRSREIGINFHHHPPTHPPTHTPPPPHTHTFRRALSGHAPKGLVGLPARRIPPRRLSPLNFSYAAAYTRYLSVRERKDNKNSTLLLLAVRERRPREIIQTTRVRGLLYNPLAHSLTHLLARSLTHSLAHSLTRSLTHSLTHPVTMSDREAWVTKSVSLWSPLWSFSRKRFRSVIASS